MFSFSWSEQELSSCLVDFVQFLVNLWLLHLYLHLSWRRISLSRYIVVLGGSAWSNTNSSMGDICGSKSRGASLVHGPNRRCSNLCLDKPLVFFGLHIQTCQCFDYSWGFHCLTVWSPLIHHAFVAASKSRDSGASGRWSRSKTTFCRWVHIVGILDWVEELHGLVLEVCSYRHGSQGCGHRQSHHHWVTGASSSLLDIAAHRCQFLKALLVLSTGLIWSLDVFHDICFVAVSSVHLRGLLELISFDEEGSWLGDAILGMVHCRLHRLRDFL